MSDPAAPWWAEVQHLRPREDHAEQPTPPRAPSRRFAHGAAEQQHEAAVATLEHEVADPWTADDDAVAPWAETLAQPERTPLWDEALEEAFARTPSWADEDDERLLPKGANRIENGRRTIEIRGQVDRIHGFTAPPETNVATRSGRRPARRPSDRFERRPDRVAMWAFLLGLLLIGIAAFFKPGDADASVRAAVAQPPAAQVATVAADGTLARR